MANAHAEAVNAAPLPSGAPRFAANRRNQLPVWILVGLNVFLFLALYGRFGDLIVDTSREVTVPWRILHGDAIYRDFNYEYGPLAPYLVAGAYALFGVHLLTLNLAGLMVSTAVTVLFYALARRYLDQLPAFFATVFFLFVFAFQFTGPFNIFTYVFPYTFAASLGVLLLLLSFHAGERLLQTGKPRWHASLGLWAGLICLTKIEFILAEGAFIALLLAGLFIRHRRGNAGSWRRAAARLGTLAGPAALVLALAGAYVLPKVDFAAYFRTEVAGMASLDLPFARRMMGVDALGANLKIIGGAALAQAGLVLAFFGADLLAQTIRARAPSSGLHRLCRDGLYLLTAACGWWVVRQINAFNALTTLTLWIPSIGLGAAALAWREGRQGRPAPQTLWLLAVSAAALALMLRQLFNARPVHYGGFLLAPALLVFMAAAFKFVPAYLRRLGSDNRFYFWGVAVFLAAAGFQVSAVSWRHFRNKSVPLATARGTLRLPPDQQAATRQLLDLFRDKRDYTMLVLPEGNLLNFLLDSPPRTYSYAYTPGLLDTPAKEDRVVRELRELPVDYVVVVTRPTAEFGFARLGKDYGVRLKQAIDADYRTYAQIGPPPLNDQNRFGILVLERKDRTASAPVAAPAPAP